MSTFVVSIERLSDVWEHPNADRLELARVASQDYQFVIPKGVYITGDLVVYFPLDSLIPDEHIEAMGLTGRLAGTHHNRVKTVKLRGAISQGLVAQPETLGLDASELVEGQDVTEQLGVTKYEPPAVMGGKGIRLTALPPLVTVYDLENAERYRDVVSMLMERSVWVTEKLEGSHFAASLDAEDTLRIHQRRNTIELAGARANHIWYKVAEDQRIPDLLHAIRDEAQADHIVTVRGEVVGPGIQGNIYKLNAPRVHLFEIEVDGVALSPGDILSILRPHKVEAVPTLAEDVTLAEWLAGKPLREASDGPSQLNLDVLREGVVIRPMEPFRVESIGDVIVKQRSPEYLANE